jgi:hypothetical protein
VSLGVVRRPAVTVVMVGVLAICAAAAVVLQLQARASRYATLS